MILRGMAATLNAIRTASDGFASGWKTSCRSSFRSNSGPVKQRQWMMEVAAGWEAWPVRKRALLGLRREVSRGLECKYHVRVGLLLNSDSLAKDVRCLYVDVNVNSKYCCVDMTWHGDTVVVS